MTVPVPDRAAARSLREALDRVGYSEDGVVELLGDEAYSGGREDTPLHERRLDGSPLATAVRLLFLGLPASVREAERALGTEGVRALEAAGLAEVGAEVVPGARVTPVRDVLIASDGYSRAAEDPPDYVAPYSPTSRLCDLLTPRPRVRRALDVGTGNGVQAVFAAQHSRSVVATDVNPRALAYAGLNAGLNGLDNLEWRRGSLFEPAGDERFDLVVCNAPFVVSPERRWAYRDSGLRGDAVSERVVSEAAAHLEEGGYATLLVSWLARDEDSAAERPLAWVEDIGCDAWVLAIYEADPLDHAAGWNSHLAGDAAVFARSLDEWSEYLRELDAGWIVEGAVLLHRRSARRNTVRFDSVDPEDVDVADGQVRRAFAARARLAELRRDDLLDERPRVRSPLRIEEELGRRGATVVLGDGTLSTVDTTRDAVEVLRRLDGSTPLRRALHAAGLAGTQRRRAVALVRELLDLGALELR